MRGDGNCARRMFILSPMCATALLHSLDPKRTLSASNGFTAETNFPVMSDLPPLVATKLQRREQDLANANRRECEIC
jgi:hypothetical protein